MSCCMENLSLFSETKVLTKVIHRRKDFDSLFEGFTKLRAISYVVSPDLLLDFFDSRGYTQLEVIVGENLAEPMRQGLSQKGVEVTQRLAERVANKTLSIYVPEKTIHTKLYLLEGPHATRVIVGSPNLTETARQASRQTNYVWYVDVAPGDPWYQQVLEDYSAHLKGTSLFMGDLTELFQQRPEMDKKELVEMWLKGGVSEETDLETNRVLQELSAVSLQTSQEISEEKVISVELPETPSARKQIERFLAPLKPMVTKDQIQVSSLAYLRYVQENHGFPIMQVDLNRRQVRLGINGTVETLTEAVPDPEALTRSLKHLEDYLQTVEWGQSPDPKFAKTSMFEALLYVMASPFAHSYMTTKRRRYGVLDNRGPRFLYIFGPSQNGKSTFLRFALKLLTGHNLQPFSGSDFTKRKILNALSIGTVFPLVFDDLVPSQRGSFEEVMKSYWEVWWREDYVAPQILMSSNVYSLKEWAKSRVKKLDFDVHFSPNESHKEKLAEIFSSPNPLFRWFSYLYLQHLEKPGVAKDDELQVARLVLKELYAVAKKPVPDYFPEEPIEKLYDPGKRSWQDLLKRLKKATLKSENERLLVTFADDLQHYEIKEYLGCLPQTIKHRLRGKTLIIESPSDFKTWLDGHAPARRFSFLGFLKGKSHAPR